MDSRINEQLGKRLLARYATGTLKPSEMKRELVKSRDEQDVCDAAKQVRLVVRRLEYATRLYADGKLPGKFWEIAEGARVVTWFEDGSGI